MTQPDLPRLDKEGTLERLKGDMEFLHTLFQVFLDDLPSKVAALSQAIEERDLEGILRTAHSIKGAAATIGAPAAREAAYTVEAHAREEDIAAALDAAPQLFVQLDSLSEALEKEIA